MATYDVTGPGGTNRPGRYNPGVRTPYLVENTIDVSQVNSGAGSANVYIAQNSRELNGLADYLDFTVTSVEVSSEKPAPTIFRAALRKANSTPDESVHVGDQIASDVEGALAFGIKPILLDRDCNHIGFERCPRIESLSELPDLLSETS